MDVIKKIIFVLVLALQFVNASDLQNAFNEGNKFYQQGEYERAIESYLKIIEDGYESGTLYFNLGNAYYKLNQLGAARLNYERAADYLKNDEALEENIKLLRLRLVDQIEPPPKFFLFDWWSQVVNFIAADVLVWIFAGLFWLVLILFSIRYYFRTRGRGDRFRIVFVSIFIFFIFFTLISIQKIYNLETERFGIIMKPSVTLLAEPKLGGTEVFILHEGTKIKIERTANDWFEIRLEDGKTGWLEHTNLEII